MPRACPVEAHVRQLHSRERDTPRGKPVASRAFWKYGRVAGKREVPRDKPVASFYARESA